MHLPSEIFTIAIWKTSSNTSKINKLILKKIIVTDKYYTDCVNPLYRFQPKTNYKLVKVDLDISKTTMYYLNWKKKNTILSAYNTIHTTYIR